MYSWKFENIGYLGKRPGEGEGVKMKCSGMPKTKLLFLNLVVVFPAWHAVPRIQSHIKVYTVNKKKNLCVISPGILPPLITKKSMLEGFFVR